jgi:bla regulator protein blaR1
MNQHSIIHGLETVAVRTFSTSLCASALILLVLAIQWLFKKRLPIQCSYLLGLLILVRLVLPFTPSSHFSIFNLPRLLAPLLAAQPQPPTAPALAIALSLSTVSSQAPATVASHSPAWPMIAACVWASGTLLLLGNALRQHWKLSHWCGRQLRLFDPRLTRALHDCGPLIKNRPALKMISTPDLKTPALFGFHKPVLLLPEGILDALTGRELRMVLLHELVHLKRRDVPLNWVIIFIRSLHWFNPLVWLAARRLRQDQEMMCDARVLQLLSSDDRRVYGHTLLKLIAQFTPNRLSLGLVPFFKDTKTAQRRITMIANFKPANRITIILITLSGLVLGPLTFTRAASNSEPGKSASGPTIATGGSSDNNPSSPVATGSAVKSDGRTALQSKLQECDQSIAKLEVNVEELGKQLKIIDLRGNNTNAPAAGLEPMNIMHYNVLKIDAETQYIKEEKLLSQLKQMKPDELKEALPTVAPDPILIQLLKDRIAAENKLATLLSTYTKNHPDVIRTQALVDESKKKIDDRIAGMLVGMEARVESLKAVARNSNEKIQELQQNEVKALDQYRSYLDTKYQLESLKKFREVLALRIAQEKVTPDSSTTNPFAPGSIGR